MWWRRSSGLITSCLCILLGIVFFVESWGLWRRYLHIGVVGPGGWPVFLSILMIVIATRLIVLESLKRKAIPIPSYRINIHDIRIIRWLLVPCLSVAYTFIARDIGFVIATIVYLAVLMMAFGATKKMSLVIAAVSSTIVTLILYFAFTTVVRIPLPGAW